MVILWLYQCGSISQHIMIILQYTMLQYIILCDGILYSSIQYIIVYHVILCQCMLYHSILYIVYLYILVLVVVVVLGATRLCSVAPRVRRRMSSLFCNDMYIHLCVYIYIYILYRERERICCYVILCYAITYVLLLVLLYIYIYMYTHIYTCIVTVMSYQYIQLYYECVVLLEEEGLRAARRL